MNKILTTVLGLTLLTAVEDSLAQDAKVLSTPLSATAEPIAKGKFEPTWESLGQYQVPDWFRDAKFGIWAHWGPQCQPEQGDWYARSMYEEGQADYRWHLQHYGPPSKFGFKDVINEWKAEKWNPQRLVALYKRAGAQYFFALANHHDNFDLWESKYQPWNATRVGPKKDLIAGWAKASRDQGLPFGVSVHAAHAWSWYEPAQRADKDGPLAGVPYDGKQQKADGKGLWWDGLDPQDLYAQNHAPSAESNVHRTWDWAVNGRVTLPDAAYCEKFYNRTVDLINRYQPDLLYFDDTTLPLYPISDVGLKIAAHFYNSNMQRNAGKLKAVLFGKILKGKQQEAMVWDIERGVPATSLPLAWQTDTCIGSWHYQRSIYEGNRYKSARTVIQMLADIVSKNGNLLLNIPVRGDGSIDDKEEKVVEGIASWMDRNKESIFGTRPWKIFGEGPASDGAPISAQGFNEGKGKPFTAEDIRFTTKGDALYAIFMGWPGEKALIKSLGATSPQLAGSKVLAVTLLGSASGKLPYEQGENGLLVRLPANKPADDIFVLKITGVL